MAEVSIGRISAETPQEMANFIQNTGLRKATVACGCPGRVFLVKNWVHNLVLVGCTLFLHGGSPWFKASVTQLWDSLTAQLLLQTRFMTVLFSGADSL